VFVEKIDYDYEYEYEHEHEHEHEEGFRIRRSLVPA